MLRMSCYVEDFRILISMFLSFLQMCRFTRAEFTEGFRGLKVDSIRAMHIRLPEVAAEIMTRPGENLVYKLCFLW